MKIKHFRAAVIGPVLLLIPMACMHLGDDHHGHDHFSSYRTPYEYTTYAPASSSSMIGGSATAIWRESMAAQEEPPTCPEVEKGAST